MNNHAFNCPRCGSGNASSFQMIYQSGTQTGNFKAVSYGLKAGVIGTGGKTNSQSILANQTAPPPMPGVTAEHVIVAVVVGVVCIAVFNFALSATGREAPAALAVMIFIASSLGFLIYNGRKIAQKRELWQSKIKTWENSWMCLKCGDTWIV